MGRRPIQKINGSPSYVLNTNTRSEEKYSILYSISAYFLNILEYVVFTLGWALLQLNNSSTVIINNKTTFGANRDGALPARTPRDCQGTEQWQNPIPCAGQESAHASSRLGPLLGSVTIIGEHKTSPPPAPAA